MERSVEICQLALFCLTEMWETGAGSVNGQMYLTGNQSATFAHSGFFDLDGEVWWVCRLNVSCCRELHAVNGSVFF